VTSSASGVVHRVRVTGTVPPVATPSPYDYRTGFFGPGVPHAAGRHRTFSANQAATRSTLVSTWSSDSPPIT